jgi:hypothetical protein
MRQDPGLRRLAGALAAFERDELASHLQPYCRTRSGRRSNAILYIPDQ